VERYIEIEKKRSVSMKTEQEKKDNTFPDKTGMSPV
jgi:hypothetical protein